MTPAAIEALAAIIGMTSIGIIVLVGLKMRFNHKFRMRERPGGEDAERLTEAVEQLHDEIRLMREEFADLDERVDFTERMLSQGRAKNAIGPRESTPPV
jgi:hypothetical protein